MTSAPRAGAVAGDRRPRAASTPDGLLAADGDGRPRVCAYPPRHDYVDRLHGTVADLVARDEEWPRLPRLWDPAWVARNAASWDLAHLHFTWEQHPVDVVAEVVAAHRRAGRTIAWTAHDLVNPHRHEPGADAAYLRVLADASDIVLTLTDGAAREVRDRFGRTAAVVPHGPLTPRVLARRLRGRRRVPGPARVLLHAKSLRANLDWRAVLVAASRVVDAGVDVVVHVDVHDDPSVVAAVRRAAGRGVVVTPHRRRRLADLCDRIARADALVLPYRWGTHSGLAELAADVGTAVVASDAGHVHEQVPCVVVPATPAGVDVEALAEALGEVAAGRAPAPPGLAARDQALAAFTSAHARRYAAAMAARRVPPAASGG